MAGLFDGGDDYLDLGVIDEPDGGAAITVGGWFYVTADRDHWLVCRGTNHMLPEIVLLFADDACTIGVQGLGNTDTFAFVVGPTGVAGNRVNGTSGLRTLNSWHFVVGVMNGTSRKLYHNGSLNASHNVGVQLTVGATLNHYRLGSWEKLGFTDVLGGMAADLFIVSGELTAPQIADIYALRRFPRFLMTGSAELYLPLAGPTGTVINTAHYGCKDQSVNDNNVSAVNSAPTWAADPLPPQKFVPWGFEGQHEAVYEHTFGITPGATAITDRRPGASAITERNPGATEIVVR